MGVQRLLDGGSTMKRFRERKSWIVLIAVLLLFAACKGESPTAPPPGGGIPPGGTPPPSGVSVTLVASNPNPLVDSVVTITATVTLNNQPVANGTAVEFRTTAGVLDGNGTAVIKTTTNGVATVTLTNGSPGNVRVTAIVNNVSATRDVNFVSRPVEPPPPNTTPTISSVSPTLGRPQGGEVIRITGTNFAAPVRVLFNTGGALPVEASVQSVSPTLIEVITPPVNLGAGQQLIADIIVLTQAGGAGEQRVEASDAFTFRNEQLIPRISTITPNSGPVTGGTRVTIFGDGFQEPVQVLFNTAEAKVLNVQFDRINVETPAARDTDPTGSGPVLGPVTVIVRNINSQTEASVGAGFHYKNAMQIIAAGPGGGPTSGGTRVTIEGIGFISPLVVVIRTDQGDIGLTQISVTGTKIIAVTPNILITECGEDLQGPIVVTNIDNGDQAEGPDFVFAVQEPAIVAITPSTITENVETTFDVTVANPVGGVTRFRIGSRTVFPIAAVDNGNGTTTFTLPVPTNLTFTSVACPAGGNRLAPLNLDVTYAPSSDSCEDTVAEALTVNPADPSCVLAPAVLTTTPASGGSCAPVPNTTAAGVVTGNATITVTNSAPAGSSSLTVTSVTATNTVNTTTVLISPASATIAAGASRTFTVTVDPAAVGPFSADINFFTSAGDTTVCVSGTGI